MSSENGQLVTCDRCGKTTFRKVTGEGECDGGYTRWNNFEDIEEGWGCGHTPNKNQYGNTITKTLCPDCMKAYSKLLENFWKEKENETL